MSKTKSYSKSVGPRFRSQFTPLYTTGRVIYFSLFDITIVQEFSPPPPSPSTLLAGVLFPTNLVSLISLNPVLFRLSVASLNVPPAPFRIVSARSPFLGYSSRTQTISTSTIILRNSRHLTQIFFFLPPEFRFGSLLFGPQTIPDFRFLFHSPC